MQQLRGDKQTVERELLALLSTNKVQTSPWTQVTGDNSTDKETTCIMFFVDSLLLPFNSFAIYKKNYSNYLQEVNLLNSLCAQYLT